MQDAVPANEGSMIAVLGKELSAIEEIVKKIIMIVILQMITHHNK